MKEQIEIKFFFPLTEQNQLDLDFSASQQYDNEKREKYFRESVAPFAINPSLCTSGSLIYASGTGTVAAGAYTINSTGKSVGYWEVTSNFHINTDRKPNALARKAVRLIFGWKWIGH